MPFRADTPKVHNLAFELSVTPELIPLEIYLHFFELWDSADDNQHGHLRLRLELDTEKFVMGPQASGGFMIPVSVKSILGTVLGDCSISPLLSSLVIEN